MRKYLNILVMFLVVVYFRDGSILRFPDATSYRCSYTICSVYGANDVVPKVSIPVSMISWIETK